MINRALRYGRIAISLVVWAILTAGFAFPVAMLRGLTDCVLQAEIVLVVGMSVSAFVAWLLITLVFGRVYCSTMCPVGTLLDISARVPRSTRKARSKRYYRYSTPRNAMRYTILALMLALLIGGVTAITSILNPTLAYERICSQMALWEWALPAFAVTAALLLIILAAGAIAGRSLCNTICPVGTMLGLISRYSVFQFDIDTDLCIQCRKCSDACKSHCINLNDHVVDNSRCVCCFDCINVCPNKAIRYTTSRKRLSQPLMQRIASPEPTPEGAEATIVNPTDHSTPAS